MAFWSDGGQIFPNISVAKACGSPCIRSYVAFPTCLRRDDQFVVFSLYFSHRRARRHAVNVMVNDHFSDLLFFCNL